MIKTKILKKVYRYIKIIIIKKLKKIRNLLIKKIKQLNNNMNMLNNNIIRKKKYISLLYI